MQISLYLVDLIIHSRPVPSAAALVESWMAQKDEREPHKSRISNPEKKKQKAKNFHQNFIFPPKNGLWTFSIFFYALFFYLAFSAYFLFIWLMFVWSLAAHSFHFPQHQTIKIRRSSSFKCPLSEPHRNGKWEQKSNRCSLFLWGYAENQCQRQWIFLLFFPFSFSYM